MGNIEFKKKQLIAELINKGNLLHYSATISQLVEEIYRPPICTLSCTYITEISSIEQSKEYGTFIRIGLKNRNDNPLEIIWDILHEYGHFLSGTKAETASNLDREYLAWDFAEMHLKSYPELLGEIDSFFIYKNVCLKTYGNYN